MKTAEQRLATRRQHVDDVVTGIVRGAYPGALLFGPGGDGKSHVVTQCLERHGVLYGIANSRLTGLGLYQFLERHRNSICLIEDAESILLERNTIGVLRSATEGSKIGRDGTKLRKITYHSNGKLREFIFTGGLILTMNRGLSDVPEAEALATRLQVINYSLEEDEMIALMYEIADSRDIKTRLTPDERREVTEFVIECARRARFRLNLRMQAQAFQSYALWDSSDAGLHWHDTVDSQVQRYGVIVEPIVPNSTRALQIQKQRTVLRELLHLPPETRLQAWTKLTGKSRAAMYRRMQELGDLDASEIAFNSDESSLKQLPKEETTEEYQG